MKAKIAAILISWAIALGGSQEADLSKHDDPEIKEIEIKEIETITIEDSFKEASVVYWDDNPNITTWD